MLLEMNNRLRVMLSSFSCAQRTRHSADGAAMFQKVHFWQSLAFVCVCISVFFLILKALLNQKLLQSERIAKYTVQRAFPQDWHLPIRKQMGVKVAFQADRGTLLCRNEQQLLHPERMRGTKSCTWTTSSYTVCLCVSFRSLRGVHWVRGQGVISQDQHWGREL